jgi:hypothetical protein
MRCQAVIAITVRHGTGNEELNAGAEALRMRYSAMVVDKQPVVFLNIIADEHDYYALVYQTIEAQQPALQEVLSNGGRIGLYWCVHGNAQETKPSIESLAMATAGIINDFQLRLHKINLSACFSAGKGQKGKFDDDDVRTSMLSQFCKLLSKQCKPQSIDGLMVAGYRAVIVMYHSPDKELDPGANSYFEKMNTGVPMKGAHNTFEMSKGKFEPTHPTGLQKEELAAVAELAQELVKARKISAKAAERVMLKNQTLMKLLSVIELYILAKLVFRFDGTTEQWTFTSISNYSDNINVKEMVQAVGWNVRSGLTAKIDVPL